MNIKSKTILSGICLLLAIAWLAYTLFFAPDSYTEKHWAVHIVFLLLVAIDIVSIYYIDKFEKEELRKDNDLERKIKENQAEEEKRKLKLEEKLDDLKDKEVDRKIRFEKEKLL